MTLTEVNYTRLFNKFNQGDFILGYPITYSDILEEGKGFTSETLFTEISEYCSNEKTQENFCKSYKFGLLAYKKLNRLLTIFLIVVFKVMLYFHILKSSVKRVGGSNLVFVKNFVLIDTRFIYLKLF